ncbi:MAG TPA: M23 family metallopeptidase [Rhodanobacter sp.]
MSEGWLSRRIQRRHVSSLLLAAALLLLMGIGRAVGQNAMAPVEVRNPWPPQVVVGSDGLAHLAYELHVSNFYGDTGVLRLRRVSVFSDNSSVPLATFDGTTLVQMVYPHAAEDAKPGANLSIKPGARAIVFIWLSIPAHQPAPTFLRHRLEFETGTAGVTSVDGARVEVNARPSVVLGAPLHGRWVATEGPGNSHSHHWGSLVAVNGQLTIPQRYALDLIGVDADGHAVRAGAGELRQSKHADWFGFGTDVLAVADGVVRSAHDGTVDNKPLAPQSEPGSLTADGLYGNYVVLQLAPDVFVHYAHLQRGSVRVKAGDRVHRGEVLGHVGQSGNTGGPHLHFQVSDAATFEGSEGIPFVFDAFTLQGKWSVEQAIDPDATFHPAAASGMHRREMPLDNDVIGFSTGH